MKSKVLIVDDSLVMRTIIKSALESAGYQVIGQASTGKEAIDMAFDLQPDIITLDNVLPDMVGIDIMKVYTDEGLPSKVIMVSAVGHESAISEIIGLGAVSYITKPFTPAELVAKVKEM